MKKEQKLVMVPYDDLQEVKSQNALFIKKIEDLQIYHREPEPKVNLISTNKLSEILGVTRQTIHNWRKGGFIEGFTLGGKVFYDLEKIMNDLRKRGFIRNING